MKVDELLFRIFFVTMGTTTCIMLGGVAVMVCRFAFGGW